MKLYKSWVFTVLTLPLLAGCNQSSPTTYIGLVSAMDEEIKKFLEEAEISKTETWGNATYHIGKLKDHDVIISRAGIGKINAASGVTSLLTRYSVSRVLFTGVAGGLRNETDILDEVIATAVLEHDYGRLENDGFVWCGGDPAIPIPGEVYYPDERMVDSAYRASVEVMGEENVFKGTIATGDQFIASSAYVDYLRTTHNAYACEMEGAAIAKVCTAFKVPFALLRVLSDKADGSATETYANFMDDASEQSNKIVLKILSLLN